MRRLRLAETLFSSVGLRLTERGRLATACLPGIANPRNAWRETFRGKYLIANPRNAWRETSRGRYLAIVIIKFKAPSSMFKVTEFKIQISKFKVKTMFKTIDFRALTAILLFLLALLFSLPNLVIAIVLMMLISAILEMLRKLADWQPKKLQPKLMQQGKLQEVPVE